MEIIAEIFVLVFFIIPCIHSIISSIGRKKKTTTMEEVRKIVAEEWGQRRGE